MSNPIASRRSDRLVGAALALAVQVLLVGLLIMSHSPPASVVKAARELIFVLPRLEKPPPPAKPARVRPSSPAPTIPLPATPPIAPPINSNPGAAAPSPDQLRALGQGIFGCAPENWSSLTPQQRALCQRPGDGVAIQNAPNLMGAPNHVKDEAHWDAELARKKSPLWLPCTGAGNAPLGAAGFSPLCLLAMASEGKLDDPREWPVYETRKLAPADFYKIEQAYDAWRKAHPNAPGSRESVSVHPQ